MPEPEIKRHNKITNEMRKLIIQNYNNGKTMFEISQIFTLPKRTIISIVRIYKKEGRVEKLSMGGSRKHKITEEIQNFVRAKVDEKCDTTLHQLKHLVFSQFSVSLSHTSIASLLKDLHYSFKRLKVVTERSVSDDVINNRRIYSKSFQDLLAIKDDKKIFFIDEVGFNICMRSKYGYAPLGQTPNRVAPGIRSRNVSICCSMNKSGNIFFRDQPYAFNTKDFYNFINDLLIFVESLDLNRCTFVMDNVPFHKNKSIKELIEKNEHELIFLPPYTPQFNPIENMFSKWKDYIRRREPRTVEDLMKLITDGITLISPNDCSGFFRNMLKEMRNVT